MMFVSDQDIEKTERALLPSGSYFCDERRAFIKCITPCNVLACPGSGKTTAVIAKLKILASNLNQSSRDGICVLTHTNVAINEITRRFGKELDVATRYPHFFGTIQSFVDRYLAIPFYREKFKKNIKLIDSDYYNKRFMRMANSNRNVAYFLMQKSEEFALGAIKFNPETLEFEPGSLKNKDTPTFKHLSTIAESMLHEGIITYSQAYDFAEAYLQEHPSLPDIISSRFSIVIIDEMQDIDETQMNLLSKCFRGSCVQTLGDPNQAIHATANDSFPSRTELHFSSSMRFGDSIAQAISPLRVDSRIVLRGNESVKSLPPHVIAFEDAECEDIIHAFSLLIQKKMPQGILNNPRSKYCAVGWVGKHKDELCIPSYWPKFEKNIRTIRYKNMYSYIMHAQNSIPDSIETSKKTLWKSVLEYARIAGHEVVCGHEYTSYNELKNVISSTNAVHKIYTCLVACLTMMYKGTDINSIHKTLSECVSESLEIKNNGKQAMCFLSDKTNYFNGSQDNCNTCILDNGISISISTVHAAKGETHAATLLLETVYKKRSDAQRILPFLSGVSDIAKAKPIEIDSIKIAHVALSRPTHLLALACTKEISKQYSAQLKNNGWEICTVESIIENYS